MTAEKIPFIVLSVISSVITILAQKAGSAFAALSEIPIGTRLLVGANAVVAYVVKMVAPVGLVPYYAYPQGVSIVSVEYGGAVLAVAMAAGCTVWLGVRGRAVVVAAGLGYYAVTVLPVSGVVQVGAQAMADRYTYLPSVGLFVLAGVGAGRLWEGGRWRSAVSAGIVAVGLLLSVLTIRQIAIWKSSESFWTYVIEHQPPVSLAFNNRASYYYRQGLFDRALNDYTAAIAALRPSEGVYQAMRLSECLNDRAIVYAALDRFAEAVADYNEAIRLRPGYAEFYYNRGNAYAFWGKLSEAMSDYTHAIDVSKTPNPDYFHNRAVVGERLGFAEQARADAQSAERLRSDVGGGYGH